MNQLGKIKIVAIALVVGSLVLAPTHKADAFIFKDIAAFFQRVFGHAQDAVHIGVDSGTAASQTAETGISAAKVVIDGTAAEKNIANGVLESNFCEYGSIVNDIVDDIAGALADVGDQTKATQTLFIGKKLAYLKTSQLCLTTYAQVASGMSVTGFSSQQVQTVETNKQLIATKLASVNQQIVELEAQKDAGLSNLFKAIALSVAMNINEHATEKLVNDLKPRLAVSSYAGMADALATQVYSVEYLEKNFSGDKRKQLILSSLLKSQLVSDAGLRSTYLDTANTLIDAQIREECPELQTATDWTSNQHYSNVYKISTPRCDRAAAFQQASQEAQAIRQQSLNDARLELANGQGFQSTRSCRNVVQDDAKIRADMQAATRELAVARRARVITLAQKPVEVSGTVVDFDGNAAGTVTQTLQGSSDEDIAKANAAVAAAQAKLDNLPQRVNGGVVRACGFIDDPGSFLASQLNNYINQWIEQATDLKTENLPLFAKLAGKLSGKLFGDIVLRKENPSQVFTNLGQGFLGVGITSTAAGSIDAASSNGERELNNSRTPNNNNASSSGPQRINVLKSVPDKDYPGYYTVSWNIPSNIQFAVIDFKGGDSPYRSTKRSDSVTVRLQPGEVRRYTLEVLSSDGKVIASDTIALGQSTNICPPGGCPPATGSGGEQFGLNRSGQVAGQTGIQPRGPRIQAIR